MMLQLLQFYQKERQRTQELKASLAEKTVPPEIFLFIILIALRVALHHYLWLNSSLAEF